MRKSLTRRGLDALLEMFPEAEIGHVVHQGEQVQRVLYDSQLKEQYGGDASEFLRSGPWTSVDLVLTSPGPVGLEVVTVRKFGIWNATGNVYEGDELGAMPDDPIISIS